MQQIIIIKRHMKMVKLLFMVQLANGSQMSSEYLVIILDRQCDNKRTWTHGGQTLRPNSKHPGQWKEGECDRHIVRNAAWSKHADMLYCIIMRYEILSSVIIHYYLLTNIIVYY